jgi:transcriptional regulator of NAD metabolism
VVKVSEVQSWDVEFLPRHSKEILIFSVNGEVRGQIEVYTQEEKDRWIRAIEEIGRPLSPSNKSETLINSTSPQVNEPTTSGPSSEPSTLI